MISKLSILTGLATITLATSAMAQSPDILGGPEAASQTIHHCGLLPMADKRFTDSPVTTRVVQHKLMQLGYFKGVPSGKYDKGSKLAVKHFQREYGLKPDGVVGPITAQRLAYETHPSPNVRRCFTTASNHYR